MENGCTSSSHLACSMCGPETKCGYEERGNHQVFICDDGMKPKFFGVDSALVMPFQHEVAPAKVVKTRAKVKIKLPDINEFKKLGLTPPKMSCTHECDECDLHGKCIETVGQQQDNVPVEVEPAKHEEIPVLALLTNLLYEKK